MNTAFKSKTIAALRWIAILPAALCCFVIAYGLINLGIHFFAPNQDNDFSLGVFLSRGIAAAAASYYFVLIGALIAPNNKRIVLLLMLIICCCLGAIMIFVLSSIGFKKDSILEIIGLFGGSFGAYFSNEKNLADADNS